jgi:hypothetical protein
MLLLTSHTRIIVLFAANEDSQFTALGKLELRRLIPSQTSGIFGIE